MNRSIMMKKFGVEESQVYVEQSTLLEPNNIIPSWVSNVHSIVNLIENRKLEMKRKRKLAML